MTLRLAGIFARRRKKRADYLKPQKPFLPLSTVALHSANRKHVACQWGGGVGRGREEEESEGGGEERIHDLINKQKEKKEENKAWCIVGEDIFYKCDLRTEVGKGRLHRRRPRD